MGRFEWIVTCSFGETTHIGEIIEMYVRYTIPSRLMELFSEEFFFKCCFFFVKKKAYFDCQMIWDTATLMDEHFDA